MSAEPIALASARTDIDSISGGMTTCSRHERRDVAEWAWLHRWSRPGGRFGCVGPMRPSVGCIKKVWCRNPEIDCGARLSDQALFPTRHACTGPAMEPCCAKWWPIIAASVRSASRGFSRRFAASAAVKVASLTAETTIFLALAFATRLMVTLTVGRGAVISWVVPRLPANSTGRSPEVHHSFTAPVRLLT